MRLVIPLCRYCVRNRSECEYKQEILEAIKPTKFKGTVTHNCPIYRTLVPVVIPYKQRPECQGLGKSREEIIAEGEKIGARVKVVLKELEIGTCYRADYDEEDEATYEWVDAGEAMGTVIVAPIGKNRFFGVRLDDPVDLVLPERGKGWDTAHEQRIKERWLPANKLEFITEARGGGA